MEFFTVFSTADNCNSRSVLNMHNQRFSNYSGVERIVGKGLGIVAKNYSFSSIALSLYSLTKIMMVKNIWSYTLKIKSCYENREGAAFAYNFVPETTVSLLCIQMESLVFSRSISYEKYRVTTVWNVTSPNYNFKRGIMTIKSLDYSVFISRRLN